MSQAGDINSTNTVIPSDVAIDYVTDSGTAIASANILNVLGGNNTSTSGSGNTITINSAFKPNKEVTLSDDFFENFTGVGELNWGAIAGHFINGTSTNPGIYVIEDGTSAGVMLNANNAFNLALGSGAVTVNFVIDLVALSTAGNRYTVTAGLMQATSGASFGTPTQGVYLTYADNVNGGNWLLNCNTSSVITSVDSGVAASTGFVNLGFTVNAAGTSVSFTINGTAVGTAITTNIPTASITPACTWIRSSGALPASKIDLFYMKQTLTTAR